MSKEKCDCGNYAVWMYSPGYSGGGNNYSCDDCVPRGCSCNNRRLYQDEYAPEEEDGVEGVDWKWLVKDKEWTTIDEKGREWPCAEYWYDENNFEDEEE